MPYYDYVCEKCGHRFEENLKIAERDIPTKQSCKLEDCEGKVNMSFSTPHIGDPWHHAGKKVDEGFKDKLRDIKSRHKHSTINV